MSSDWEFIFDGVFGYLTSPLWIVPLNDFIDAQSVVFEPSEENQLAWTEVHDKYKKLVESLLGSYLKDVGITEEQFMTACVSSSAQRVPEMQSVLEQLYAADKFEIFKTMMVQRNVELQLQALEMIQKRQGVVTKSEPQVAAPVMPKTEEDLLAEVLRQSAKEYEEAQELRKIAGAPSDDPKFNERMEVEIAQQQSEKKMLQTEVLKKQEETKKTISETIKKDDELATNTDTASQTKSLPEPSKNPATVAVSDIEPKVELIRSSVAPKIPPISVSPETPRSAADEWINSARKENESARQEKPVATSLEKSSSSLSEIEMKKRAEYLKQQRDRLLELKKQEREKQLSAYTEAKPERPTSARVARQAVAGTIVDNTPRKDDKKIAIRKALADKLKKEVVYR